MDCVLLGDSIAVGVAGALGIGGWLCPLAAHVGARTSDLPRQVARAGLHRAVVISTGSNDPVGGDPTAILITTRRALGPARVVWLLPYRRSSAYRITQVAFRFGDPVLDLAAFPSRDHVHPADYRPLAAALVGTRR